MFKVCSNEFLLEEELLERVRQVSEDYLYDTVEFIEFLQLMSKQQATAFTREDLLSSFKYIFQQTCLFCFTKT